MSMVKCENCDQIFDSDDDPDCFVEVGNMRRMTFTKVYCEWCRQSNEELELRELCDPPEYEHEDKLNPKG